MARLLKELETLEVSECDSLEDIVDVERQENIGNDAEGRFHNLSILEVNDCKSMEEIFDLQFTPQAPLNFKGPQHVVVTGCPRREYLFPLSIANDLMKLETIQIRRCDGMKEIVARSYASDGSNFMFKFPKLTTLLLLNLPELRRFYQGTHTIEFQVLTCLLFGRCDKLETLGAGTKCSEVKPFLSSLVKVISNLETVAIFGLKEIKRLRDTIIGNNVNLMLSMKDLTFDGLSSIEILFWFLHRCPNLESLNLRNSTKEVMPKGGHVSLEEIGTVVQPKNMTVEFSDIPLNIGFENGAILQRVENLCIVECYYSTKLIPSSLELTYLSYLEVSKCDGLRSLLTSSTAKSLVRLTTMKVAQCAMMEEIVTVEENEGEKQDEVVFCKLKSLELVSLRNLTSFSNSQSKAVFTFPSLERVKVSECLKLEKFSEKISTPSLDKVDILEGEEGNKWLWEGDLNATIQKIFTHEVLFEFCQNLKLSYHPELQQLWYGEISPPGNCFNNLRELVVENCSFLSTAVFPTRLLPCFENLEELQVSSSPVEVIFDIDGSSLTETKGKPFHLTGMTLNGLQNLKCMWNKDPQSIVSFPNLKEIVVNDCAGIKTLFPASLARNLVRVKKIEIRRCHALEEIVGKEEAVADGVSIIEFHYLTTLTLAHLPSLKFFYPRRYNLKFPSLENLCVFGCGKLDTFASDFQNHQGAVECEDVSNITTSRQSLCIADKFIPNLETLTLNGKDMKMLSHGHFPDGLLHKLKFLELWFGDSYEAGATLPFKFFKKVPNLQRLVISNFTALDEIVPTQRPEDIDHIINTLARVRELALDSLPLLSSIGLDNSWADPVAKNLILLQIVDCPQLTILVPPSAVSFCSLKELTIMRCHGFVSLFSSSVAKSLVQLRKMVIAECGSITQIVNDGNDESASDEMIFESLEYVTLSHLPRLESFYWGNATLEFSTLLMTIIEQCPKMKCFSPGFVRANNFFAINASRVEYDLHNYRDLNTTVQKLFELAQFTRGVQDLKLGDYPQLGNIWHGIMAVPEGGFSKLKTLIVDGCPFLSHYVIPFHLLGLLSNLEDLQVRNCDSVKAIFEVGSLSSLFSIPLKTLTLQKLPGLENVWNNDPQEFLSFQSLQHVLVDGCRSLRSLFPASMSRRKLESLEILRVQICEGLVEIVANYETVPRGATSNSIMFPNLTTLQLWVLPQLKCICPGLDDLEWPKLKLFHLYHCDQLIILPTKGLGHVPVDMETIVSFEKGFPNLEQLSLNKADIMNINWRGKCQVNFIQRVKSLTLQCFHDDADEFPCELFRKGSFPNLEILQVFCCSFKGIFSSQILDVDLDNDMFPHLKGLELVCLWYLESIGLEHSWEAPILENLETLLVEQCHRLRSLEPFVVSLSKLRELRVFDCEGLVYLFTLSTARSLVLLEELYIVRCESIQEILFKEGDGSDQDDVSFKKLKRLWLVSLQRLGCFHSGNSTLNLPCLELVFVHQCPKMRIFSDGAINSPEHLQVSTGVIEFVTNFAPQQTGMKFQSSHQFTGLDLNVSIGLIFSTQLANFARDASNLQLSGHPELQEIWEGLTLVPDGGFSNLKYLKVDGCQFLSHYVIPCHLVPFLRNLEDLQVRNCDSIKAIFEVGSLFPFFIPVKRLTLQQLPHLENVWNEDPQEVLSFPSLQHVYIHKCRSLRSLFPASMAQCKLESLEFLLVECCEGLVEIVASEEIASEESVRNLIIFPSLTELKLLELPELKCIYSGVNNMEWPKLRELIVYQCGHLTNIGVEGLDYFSLIMEANITLEEVFPNLDHVSLCKEDIVQIQQAPFPAKLLQRAKFLKLLGFCDDSDVLPYGFLERESLPHVEGFAVSRCNFRQIFTSEISDLDGCANEFFSQLKTLELISLSNLSSIGLEHTSLPENLEILKVRYCHSLISLAPSTVSFTNLRGLDVNY
ncbi:uncharacterized protein LOC114718038 [Neltuma alba]|uniref:uncharacterized protein LOC114718038 n=1 Tax=Neltuma alba TaxID=207710 RepID=UPI0010A42735|nr:uncharacterized protein LOC114718038 [Prosopis alba]